MAEIETSRVFDGKKFLWDGEEYESEEQATAVEQTYLEKGFEVRKLMEGDRGLLYTRRLVSSASESEPEGGGGPEVP